MRCDVGIRARVGVFLNAPHLAYVYIVIVPPLFVSTLAWCVTGQCWKPTGVGIQIYIGTHVFFHYHARLLGVGAHVQLETRTSPLWSVPTDSHPTREIGIEPTRQAWDMLCCVLLTIHSQISEAEHLTSPTLANASLQHLVTDLGSSAN